MLARPSTTFFAAAPPGIEAVCAYETARLGFQNTRITQGGVTFTGDFETLCTANLCLRTASRVLLRVDQFFAAHVAELHKKAAKIPWENFLSTEDLVDVRAACRKSKIYHSEAAAERVARGIADRLKLTDLPTFGEGAPDEAGGKTTVLVRIDHDCCTVSLDTSGAHLHRRGYRLHAGQAPLRETLAAAVLLMSGWSYETEMLIDPMCGSGTLPIEGALIASDTSPGLLRTFGFTTLPFFDRQIFEETKARLQSRIKVPAHPILASDMDEEAVRITKANVERAGLSRFIEVFRQDISALTTRNRDSLVICNPPYGKRIGERRRLRGVYRALGDAVHRMERTHLALVTADPSLAAAANIAFENICPPFPNGGIRVQLFCTKKEFIAKTNELRIFYLDT